MTKAKNTKRSRRGLNSLTVPNTCPFFTTTMINYTNVPEQDLTNLAELAK